MPDTGAPWNIPYVAGTDLVRDWPTDSLALANAIDAGLDIGLGTNVVQTVKTDTFSTTSTSYTPVTGLTVTITPSSATSKVLVVAGLAISNASTNAGEGGSVRLSGGNTGTFVGDAASNRTRAAAGHTIAFGTGSIAVFPTLTFLDSPATTSPVTYGVEMLMALGTGMHLNRTGTDTDTASFQRFASSITAIEVAA